MIIKNVALETVCGITSKLPENNKPEVAFAGKSNVGKSSLINRLQPEAQMETGNRWHVPVHSRERPRPLISIM